MQCGETIDPIRPGYVLPRILDSIGSTSESVSVSGTGIGRIEGREWGCFEASIWV